MSKDFNDVPLSSLLASTIPLSFQFSCLSEDAFSHLMASRAGIDSAASFIIPTYVLVSSYNIIYAERKKAFLSKI